MALTITGPEPKRGHIRIDDDAGCIASATDLGDGLHFYPARSLTLGTDDARTLAAALNTWADSRTTT